MTTKFLDDSGVVVPPIRPYDQAAEPTLERDHDLGVWLDSDDLDTPYLVFRRGSGDQVKAEIGPPAVRFWTDQSSLTTLTVTLEYDPGASGVIYWGDGATTSVSGDGTAHGYTHNYSVEGQYEFRLVGELDKVDQFQVPNQLHVYGDISTLRYLTGCWRFYFYSTSVSGDIAALEPCVSTTYLYFNDCSGVYGDISVLANMTGMVRCFFTRTAVEGDIASLSGLTSMQYLYLNKLTGPGVYGDIAAFTNMASMIKLHCYNTNGTIEGDISNLSGMTSATQFFLQYTDVDGDVSSLSGLNANMTYLYLVSTKAYGDVGALAALTNLKRFYVYDMDTLAITYGNQVLPAWSGANLQLSSSGLDSTEVDNFMIRLAAAGGTDGTLNLAGSNGARTSASDAAKATLLSNNWSVAVNE